MTALNIFTAIGEFFTEVLFAPLNWIRLGGMDWIGQNFMNWFFIAIGFVLFGYWMKESAKFKKNNTEDLA